MTVATPEDLGTKVGSIGPTRARCFAKLEEILAEMAIPPAAWVSGRPPGASPG